jgi:hypothetical protein
VSLLACNGIPTCVQYEAPPQSHVAIPFSVMAAEKRLFPRRKTVSLMAPAARLVTQRLCAGDVHVQGVLLPLDPSSYSGLVFVKPQLSPDEVMAVLDAHSQTLKHDIAATQQQLDATKAHLHSMTDFAEHVKTKVCCGRLSGLGCPACPVAGCLGLTLGGKGVTCEKA